MWGRKGGEWGSRVALGGGSILRLTEKLLLSELPSESCRGLRCLSPRTHRDARHPPTSLPGGPIYGPPGPIESLCLHLTLAYDFLLFSRFPLPQVVGSERAHKLFRQAEDSDSQVDSLQGTALPPSLQREKRSARLGE